MSYAGTIYSSSGANINSCPTGTTAPSQAECTIVAATIASVHAWSTAYQDILAIVTNQGFATAFGSAPLTITMTIPVNSADVVAGCSVNPGMAGMPADMAGYVNFNSHATGGVSATGHVPTQQTFA